MRTVGVVSVARSDYGIFRPVLKAITASPSLDLRLFVSGMHLAPEYGSTVRAIEADGFPIAERVEMLLASNTPSGVAASMGLGVIGFAQALARSRPDVLLLLGDRFEMYAAAIAALPQGIPMAHIHGGETTEGAIDEAIRHAITKMSHLHFPATDEYARRIVQMGEEPWRVTVSGAPALDNLNDIAWLDRDALRARFGLRIPGDFLMVTFHPVTLEHGQAEEQIRTVLEALDGVGCGLVFTFPNADADSRIIIEHIREFARTRPEVEVTVSLGTHGYFSMLRESRAVVGNSSSGIIEAASFGLPVLNIGNRQAGRLRTRNVVDVPVETGAIREGLAHILSPGFREGLKGLVNPYGDGHAAGRIVAVLESADLSPGILKKRFTDLSDVPWEGGLR